MKKLILLVLSLAMLLSLCACGGGSDTPKNDDTTPLDNNEDSNPRETTPAGDAVYYVGEEIPSDYFPFTVTEATFSNQIVSTKSDDFLTPTSDTGSGAFSADKDYQWLYYEVEYTYSGTSTLSLIESLFMPTVYYGEYEFSSDYFTFGKIDNSWYIFRSDYDGVGHPLLKDLSSNGYHKYEPLDDTVYVIRGVIKVPTKAIEDTETPIYLKLLNVGETSPSAITMNANYIKIER